MTERGFGDIFVFSEMVVHQLHRNDIMIKKAAKYIGIVLGLFLLAGCASQKEIVYFQDVLENYEEVLQQGTDIRITTDDLLSIMVNSKNPELVQMLNMPMVAHQITASGYSSAQQKVLGYLVDKDGNIDFPQIGKMNVLGLTRYELSDKIKQTLIAKGLVNDPIVTVQFLNFKVSVIGEVNRPGEYDVVSDRITILDALSRAGDLTIYGRRDNVKIIREENGKRIIATVDLRSKELLNSPYFYLKQNDVVYVEPNKARAGQREINQNRSISTFSSIISVMISIAVLIFK